MRIALIRPNMTNRPAEDAMEPLAFAILAALTPPDVELLLLDELIGPIAFDEPVDLVALAVETYAAKRAYEIAGEYRRHGIPVVMGGFHPTLLPEEASLHADAVVLGDCENVWPKVVEDARNQRLQPIYQGGSSTLTGLKYSRTIFHGKRYKDLALVQFGRGCRYACDFCSIHAFYQDQVRQREVREVAAEIAGLPTRRVLFVDDNLCTNIESAKRLFQALIPLRIKWSCQASLNIARDPEFLRLMARSGCVSVTIGFESMNPENLQQMGKSWNGRLGEYSALVRRLHDHGIMIYGTFVFGYDQDNADTFSRALEFAIESKFFLANFNPLMPMPGTSLIERLRAEKRLIYDRWWLDERYRYGQCVFHPRGMNAEDLADNCYAARMKFNSFGSVLRRGINWRANCRNVTNTALFLAANWITRREICRKQGCKLGTGLSVEPLGSSQVCD